MHYNLLSFSYSMRVRLSLPRWINYNNFNSSSILSPRQSLSRSLPLPVSLAVRSLLNLFTISSKCSKIQWLHQLKFKTWKMCPPLFHRYTECNRNANSMRFILIKLKSNFFLFLSLLNRIHFGCAIICRFTILSNWIVIEAFYAINARTIIIKA